MTPRALGRRRYLTVMNLRKDMNDKAPGGLYLCQVNEHVSCGACCGLYNVADPSRDTLHRMLMRRTMLFKTVDRDADAIEAFGQQMASEVNSNRPYPEFHHCPFIGLIGSKHSRVGCLLHPWADGNHGADFRGLSFYGGLACKTYFCPSYNLSPKLLKQLICHSADDWYSYGLMITETDLLCSLYKQIKLRCGDMAAGWVPQGNPSCMEIGRQLINLKISWPFQSDPAIDRVNYFFKDNLYSKPAVRYGSQVKYKSRYDEIFKNLVSSFQTPDQIHRAEEIIDGLIEDTAGVLWGPAETQPVADLQK